MKHKTDSFELNFDIIAVKNQLEIKRKIPGDKEKIKNGTRRFSQF